MGLCNSKYKFIKKNKIIPINYSDITIPSLNEYKQIYKSKSSSEIKRIIKLDGIYLMFLNNSYKKYLKYNKN